MKSPVYSSLLAKFLLAAALPLLLLLVFANVVYVYLKTDELRARHLEDVTNEIQLLATQLSIPVWQFDRETVKSLVRTLEGSPYIVCARLDEYESYSDTIRQTSNIGDCSPAIIKARGADERVKAEVTYDYDGQIVRTGLLEAILDLSQVGDSLAKSLLNELILFILYVLIFLIGFTVALKATVLKPLQMVMASIQSYQNSGTRALVDWKSKDELGTLIAEYNKNLTRMDEAEQALLDKNVVLDEARREAEDARDIAERTAKAKSEFLANMSHEIRTPMNAIQGLTEMMSRTRLDVKQGGYLHRIRNSADILLAIINDILDFSKIEAGKLELERVDFSLAEAVEKVADVESFTAANKGIDIIFKVSPEVPDRLQGDPMRFSQVLINLISNAIKFTEKGEVIVSIELVQQANDKVTIRGIVSDTGVGIAESALATLFESFTQADGSTTRKFGGTGLGLTISKRLVELMNGSIVASSKLGQGSKFSFTAEFAASTRAEPMSLLEPFMDHLPSIIIVGESHSCDEIYVIFKQFNLNIERLKTGTEAIERIRLLDEADWDPNRKTVVYVDVASARVSLSELTEQVDQLARPAECRLVPVLSVKQRDEVDAGVRNAHIASFMTKPVLALRTINSLIESLSEPDQKDEQDETLSLEAGSLKGARILVVEDNQVNQLVAREMLESAGVIVRVADDGQQALTRLEDKSIIYDAVLMDVHMPVMDGYGATKAIRETYGNRLPIVALTANATIEEKKRCLEIGMSDFLTKPIDSAKLFKVLSHWVGVGRGQSEPLAVNGLPAEEGRDSAHTSGGEPQQECHSAKDDKIASQEVVSVEELESRFKGHPTIIPRIFKSFEESFSDFENQFMEAYEASDGETMYRLAHSLKGSAANISAERLRQLSYELEEKLKDNKQAEAMEWFPWVVDHLSKVITFIKGYLKNEMP